MIDAHEPSLRSSLTQLDDGPSGDRARERLRGERLCAPELLDLCESVFQRRNTAVHADDVISKFADKGNPQQGILQQLFALNCHVAISRGR